MRFLGRKRENFLSSQDNCKKRQQILPLCGRMTMKSKSNNKKQIPFGDDNQRCNSNGKNNGKCAVEAGKLLGGEADFSAALLTKA
jgi:hypothetical protein